MPFYDIETNKQAPFIHKKIALGNNFPENIVIGLGMRIKSRTTLSAMSVCMHVKTDKENITEWSTL